ncbi:hypothetical protein MMC11_007374 [Xylographa trunciseda]|nr:hypothetical protein [Xylographa trunciseda]
MCTSTGDVPHAAINQQLSFLAEISAGDAPKRVKNSPPSAERSTSSAEGGILSNQKSTRIFWGTGEGTHRPTEHAHGPAVEVLPSTPTNMSETGIRGECDSWGPCGRRGQHKTSKPPPPADLLNFSAGGGVFYISHGEPLKHHSAPT